ncbi:DUF1868 domain-containing protein [Rhizobium leguminosarum]|uniref:DUF1868 domain-containing protein n=1 Tax=Rhizobium leguminosarum TaxID=384 RepID=UPI001C940F49|nr:DUF1868 domain-containing protein [Rhizobium leguminosarum]MBY5760268.1 DUF1868 domain-containing protein [Rhizobium leguminosarum]
MSQKSEEGRPEAGPRERYPSGVGQKFDVDGAVRPFAGNTIICHLNETSPLQEPLKALYAELETSRLAALYTLLPPSSWHMTVFEGICDQVRKPEYWPSELPLDASLTECNAFFEDRLNDFDCDFRAPIRMSISSFRPLVDGISLKLTPIDAAEEIRLRGFRNQLADVLTLRPPGHDDYVFHLSIAYLIRHLTEDQGAELSALQARAFDAMPAEFELGAPEFCHFGDMFEFRRQFFLESEGSNHERIAQASR